MWLLFLDLSTQTAGGVGNLAGGVMDTSYVGNFFIATVVVTAIILSLTHLFKIVYTRNFLARWWQAVSGGLLHGGLLVSILLSFLPAKFLTQFSPWMLNIFTSGKGHFWWTVLPILGLL